MLAGSVTTRRGQRAGPPSRPGPGPDRCGVLGPAGATGPITGRSRLGQTRWPGPTGQPPGQAQGGPHRGLVGRDHRLAELGLERPRSGRRCAGWCTRPRSRRRPGRRRRRISSAARPYGTGQIARVQPEQRAPPTANPASVEELPSRAVIARRTGSRCHTGATQPGSAASRAPLRGHRCGAPAPRIAATRSRLTGRARGRSCRRCTRKRRDRRDRGPVPGGRRDHRSGRDQLRPARP